MTPKEYLAARRRIRERLAADAETEAAAADYYRELAEIREMAEVPIYWAPEPSGEVVILVGEPEAY